jgi:pyrophosphatase PpaX
VPRWPDVVFDLDGTLADTIGLIVDSYQHAFTMVLGAPEDDALIRSWIGQPLTRTFRERSPEQADELFATYIEWNHANTERLIRRYVGVDDLLAGLAAAEVRFSAATSKLRGSGEAALRVTGLDAYLNGQQALVTLEDTTEHKPDTVEDLRTALLG